MSSLCYLLLTLFIIHADCCNNSQERKLNSESDIHVFTIFPETEFQVIAGFGASDAWSCQFVGDKWPEEKKNRMADLLFSRENDEYGNPAGIGLSVWRFNIGSGSSEQGSNSDIRDEWRRTECFLDQHQQYNWEKQAGQTWFISAAKERGVENFIAFLNSPPVAYSKNGKAYSSSPNQYNLSPENYASYVKFLINVLENLHTRKGIEFDFISPFNEPQWDWTSPNQEGSPAGNAEMAEIIRLLNEELEKKEIDTKIEIPEAGKIDYLFQFSDKPDRGSQVGEFFNPQSENYIGNLEHVAQKLCGHSYHSTWNFSHMRSVREQFFEEMKALNPSLEYWMTEYCLLEDNQMIKGKGRDLGMKAALYTARVIHADLTYANASSWQWWLAISPYDYKDGLIYIDRNKNDGEIYESKLLWILGHYSLFIRPGMKRILVKSDSLTGNDIDFSAYKSIDEKQLVIVVSNYNSKAFDFELRLNKPDKYSCSFYLTSPEIEDNLRLIESGGILDELISIPGNSLMTVVLNLN